MDQSEQARIAALRSYGMLDTPNEPEFDAIVKEARVALGVPIVLISLVDEHRQWFKARVGLNVSETPRCISFCTHALTGPDIFVVPDATADERFASNPLVTGAPFIRFYAGAPLSAGWGRRVGTLCAIDTVTREGLTLQEARWLPRLTEKTMLAMEHRKVRRAAACSAA